MMIERRNQSRWLSAAVAAMVLGVAFQLLHALFDVGGPGLDSLSDAWVYTAVEVIAVLMTAARALLRRSDRVAWALMAFGLLTWTAGDLVWTLWLDHVANPPYPSIADPLYLAMYPAMYVALMLMIRRQLRAASAAQWLDGLVTGLSLTAFGVGLILPTVLALNQGRLVQDLVNLAYPVGDLTLLAFVIVAFSLSAWRPGRLWALLGAGMAIDAVADLIFTYESARGTYVAGGVLDTLWPAAMLCFAIAAWQPAPPRRPRVISAPHTILLPSAAAVGALGLLAYASFGHVTPLAVLTAAAAILVGMARALLTYVENVRMLRHSAEDAITDGLSGLGNRRRLLRDIDAAIAQADHSGPWTLVFFDLNGFKRYNDTFGHPAGDSLLARFGAALGAATGEFGNAYRLGGDEFCVLLRGGFQREDPLVQATAAALSESGAGFVVSAAFGLAVIPTDAADASAALTLADQRMYADKARDRDAAPPSTRDVLMQLLTERTPDLHVHVSGVGQLVRALGRDFGFDSEQLDELLRAAELHDIGKLAVPDEILHKRGPLSDREWEFMRKHPAVGERILNADPAMRPVARLVRASHEHWDGTGYPDRLAGLEIPLGARIIAACDAYDAMTTERCYQPARSSKEAIAELRSQAGSQFDPAVVEALARRLGTEPAAGLQLADHACARP